jgi:hypothetical protein
MKKDKQRKTSDYSHKIPSLPYKKETETDKKYPVDQRPPKGPMCKDEIGIRPEPFDGIEGRHKVPERQHYPFLTIHIDFLGLWVTIRNGGDVIVSVTNNDNGVAFIPFVELIESSYHGVSVDLPDSYKKKPCLQFHWPWIYLTLYVRMGKIPDWNLDADLGYHYKKLDSGMGSATS